MLRCHICRADAKGGWVCGHVPAADRYKLALCPRHDTPINRELVHRDWVAMMRRELRGAAETAAHELAVEDNRKRHEVTINYLDGGVRIIPCREYRLVEEGAVLMLRGEGTDISFHPMRHIRSYRVHPLPEFIPEDAYPAGQERSDDGEASPRRSDSDSGSARKARKKEHRPSPEASEGAEPGREQPVPDSEATPRDQE